MFPLLTSDNFLTQPTEGFLQELPQGAMVKFHEAYSRSQITLTALKPCNRSPELVLMEEGSDGYDSKELMYILSILGSLTPRIYYVLDENEMNEALRKRKEIQKKYGALDLNWFLGSDFKFWLDTHRGEKL